MSKMDLHSLTDDELDALQADLTHDIEQSDGGMWRESDLLDRCELERLERQAAMYN